MDRQLPTLLLIPLALLSSLAVPRLFAKRAAGSAPILKPYNATGIYAVGDKVGWNITLPEGSNTPSGTYAYTIKRNNFEIIKSGALDLSSGSGVVETTADQPEMLYLRIENPVDLSQPVNGPVGSPIAVAGAAVEPTKLQPSLPRPRDFDAFWIGKIKEEMAVPANPVLTPGDSGMPDVDFATIQMDHLNGEHVYGNFAKPKRAGKFPAILMMQWASPPYPLQKEWITWLAAKGYLVLDVEPHKVVPNGPPEYYSGLPQALKGYNSIGWDDREKSYFVQMYLRDYRAAEYLASRSDWDGKTLIATGTSMGGQQSLCVAGLEPKITHVIVEEPSGCDMNGPLHNRAAGYPNFPSNNPKIMQTAPYVDAVNFASHIKATCLVAMGFVDTVAPPAGIWTAFNQIRGPKEAAPMPEAPHNNTATQRQQLPYSTRASAWFDALAKGQKAPVRQG